MTEERAPQVAEKHVPSVDLSLPAESIKQTDDDPRLSFGDPGYYEQFNLPSTMEGWSLDDDRDGNHIIYRWIPKE
ncbi:MAG TPA: hypothetical protein VK338_02170 [Candidatus Nitrosocosmicus sp.]|nr:hypothetical protein [Candidatus Nitrosocosmicus sp.]